MSSLCPLKACPYAGGTHSRDFAIVKPLFVDGRIIAYTIDVAHDLDVGGSVPGSLAPVERGLNRICFRWELSMQIS